MFKIFYSYVLALKGTFGSYEKLSMDSTNIIFNMIRNSSNNEITQININNINKGKFYLIKYYYNGNNIWCPILTLDFRVNKNKNILYAVNLEYLPLIYKIQIFSLIFNRLEKILSESFDIKKTTEERPLPITFENIYKILKNNNNMDFSITAFDLLKIKETYLISYKILDRFLTMDCKKANVKEMSEIFEKSYNEQLKKIMEEYKLLLENYDINSIEYHKKLSKFEKFFKLYENLQ